MSGFVRRKPAAQSPSPSICRANVWWKPAPTSCACCGSDRLSKVGEDVTETLEVIPRRWKVIQTVREKFTCRDCERISAAAGALPRDTARLGGPEPAGDDRVREVRAALASEPAEGTATRERASI